MRIHRLFLAALAMSLSLTATAGLNAPVDAYEVALESVQLPQSSAGSIVIARCETCAPLQLRVSAQTSYVANGERYSLADYRQLLATVRNRADEYLTIVHDRESDTVVTIRVKL